MVKMLRVPRRIGDKNMKFALYFGNRGFFPASLIAGAREEMVKAVTDAGYDYIIAPEDLTCCGAVETRQERRKMPNG